MLQLMWDISGRRNKPGVRVHQTSVLGKGPSHLVRSSCEPSKITHPRYDLGANHPRDLSTAGNQPLEVPHTDEVRGLAFSALPRELAPSREGSGSFRKG